MAFPSGATAYKKKDGLLTITPDQKNVIWTPNSAAGGPPALSLPIANITNLQRTPDSTAKVMLKIFGKPAGSSAEPVAFLFHFNSPADPRAEANVIRDLLSRLLAGARSDDPSLPKPAATSAQPGSNNTNSTTVSGTTGSAAMAFANAAISKPASARLFDDEALKTDIKLQQSLMSSDHNLTQMYLEGRKTKPESMSDVTFNAHFWSARINLLRAHAIEANQRKGPYNVLAQIKPTVQNSTDPNKPTELKIKFSVEQIQMIMDQHPLVKRIYNENVPPLQTSEFWERFFLSKLSKKLRGERPTGLEAPDNVFDRYDEYEDITAFSSRLLSSHVPHIIDVEGNEENQGGFRSGNKQDVEMRPRGRADVPIIQTLNSLSSKLLANAVPVDNDPQNSAGLDDDTYQELSLRDLRGDAEEERIMLNIKEQSRFFSGESSGASKNTASMASMSPTKVLKLLNDDLATLGEDGAGGVDIRPSLGIDDDSESDEEEKSEPHVGSRASRKEAHRQILASMMQRRAQLSADDSDASNPMKLREEMTATCNLTHATTMEFLKQFWSAFLSGDPDRAAELGYLAEALKKSKARIEAVADDTEKTRQEDIEKQREEIVQYHKKTGRKRKLDYKIICGGRDAVMTLMTPVIASLDKAIADYNKALAAEGVQASTEL